MKFLIALTLALFSLTVSAQEASKNEKVIIKTNIFCDHCKECPTCGKGINAKLMKIKGVKMIEVDDKRMTFTVYYNAQKTNVDGIRNAISEMGYDADHVKAVPEAYDKLDGCCKKA